MSVMMEKLKYQHDDIQGNEMDLSSKFLQGFITFSLFWQIK